MKKNIISLTPNTLPGNIGKMSIEDLLNNENVAITIKNNKLTMKTTVNNADIMLEITKYPDAITQTQVITDKNIPTSQKYETIKRMRAEGMTQQQVADRLGTTASNICRIETKQKN